MLTDSMNIDKLPSIPEWFRGKKIFITGGSGFIGKCLIEKILRSCPKIGNIYLLLRYKKGLSPEQRLEQITSVALFDRLKEEQPFALSKIIPITGDAEKINLGISPKDWQLIIENVNIIYHCAASVRFDDTLTKALLLNTRGTREVCQLALETKNIEYFGHVSTAYCNADRRIIEEQLYSQFTDWRKAIELAEKMDPHTLTIFSDKFTYPLPNTYTFSKQLAEHVVNDLLSGKIACSIIRPSIVISSMIEPEPGWAENFNGPVGLFLGYGKGVLRVVYTKPDLIPDFVPSDVCAKAIIVATWKECNINCNNTINYKKPSVYNLCNQDCIHYNNREICDIGIGLVYKYPLADVLWCPKVVVTDSKYYFYYMVFFYHVLPALFIDFILFMFNRKPLLFKIQKKVFTANLALQYFITRDWIFKNQKALALEKFLKPNDKGHFDFGIDTEFCKMETYFKNAVLGGKKFLLKEDMNALEEHRKSLKRKVVISKILNTIWYLLLIWFIFFKLDAVNYICNKVYLYFEKL